ncbi:MAG: hypothetical protein SFV17_12835 [Candidatus Obscuribacter sp.]|nr:hypothetical protein [Candidatus Obscuribacter sp.]
MVSKSSVRTSTFALSLSFFLVSFFSLPGLVNQALAAGSSDNAGDFFTEAESAQTKAAATTNPVAPPPEGAPTRVNALITMKVIVPQMKQAQTKFTAFPFTVKPPKLAVPITPLPTEDKGLENMILGSGYASKLSLEKPYPDGGWRWQYAFRNGLKRSGQTPPKVMIGIYNWSRSLVKYVKPECERINEIEAKRMERYKKLVQDYEDNHKDEEMEALRLGHEPLPIKLRPIRRNNQLVSYQASYELPPGEWWITGEHKVPGLVYYWEYPIQIKAGENINLVMDDANAVLIQGGW